MEALIPIFALAGVVWTAVLMLRGGLVAGGLLTLLAGTLFGAFFFSLPTGAIPLTADRAILALFVVQFIGCWKLGLIEWQRLRFVDWTLFALVAALALSTLSHDWSYRKALPLSRLLFYWIMPLTLYLVMRSVKYTQKSGWLIIGALSLFGIYLGLTAVAEARGLSSLVFPRYISSLDSPEFLGRARGPIMNPAGNGVLLVTCLCATLLWWDRWGRAGRCGLLAASGIMLLGMYGTLTRSVWMGAGLALAILVAAKLPRHLRWPALAGAMLMAAITTVTYWEKLTEFKRDKEVSASEMAESAKLRPLLAMIAWQMFQDHPLLGVGYGQYKPESMPYFSERTIDLPIEKARPYMQHNIFLALLTETGLVGTGLFCVVLICWIRDAWRLWRRSDAPAWTRPHGLLFLGCLTGYLVNGMFHDVTIMPMMNMLLCFLAGVMQALGAMREIVPTRRALPQAYAVA